MNNEMGGESVAQEVVAWGVYAKSDEYPEPILIPEYAGSMGVIRLRLMEKARSEGFMGDFEQRLAELGWWLEPLFRASPVAAAPGIDARQDAESWGVALNEAGWTFMNSCPEQSSLLFNNCKPALRAAILKYLDIVEANHVMTEGDKPKFKHVRQIIEYMRGKPEWDGKNYDETLATMLIDLKQATSAE